MIVTSKYAHISFDLDGTLVDSLDVMRQAWEKTMDKFHLPNDFSEYKREVGLPFQDILGAMGIVDDDKEIERFYFSQTESMENQIELYPSARDFLSKIKQSGISASIITSKPRNNSERLLRSLDISVELLICGDDSVGAKPSSAPIDYLRSWLELKSVEKILYFGDMLSDIVFSVNGAIDYCHCDFGVYGQLPACLLPTPLSIRGWNEAYSLFD